MKESDFVKLVESVQKKFPDVLTCERSGLFLIIKLLDKKHITELLSYLKNDEEIYCTVLSDLFAVDYPERQKRFEIIYNLLSLQYNFRVLVYLELEDREEVGTVHHVYDCAVWYEREAWDMYGIKFNGNHDLRRILTDYEFDGHPLRKDFPLTGYKEVRYDILQKKVIYEPVNLVQEYRDFDFLSPWNGTEYVLPGDEKAKEQK